MRACKGEGFPLKLKLGPGTREGGVERQFPRLSREAWRTYPPPLQFQARARQAIFSSFWPSLGYKQDPHAARGVPGTFRRGLLLPAQRLTARSRTYLLEH